MSTQTLRVGFILKPQGVRGEIKLQPLTDDPQRFLDLKSIWIEKKDGLHSFKIESCSVRENGVFLKLEGIITPEQVDAFRNCYVCIPRDQAIDLPEDSNFISDLIGCEVYDSENLLLGKLVNILQYGAADVYVIQGEFGCMVPALKRLIISTDIEAKKIIFDVEVLQEVAVWDEN